MARARGLSKIGYEEQGQRTARSSDVYISEQGVKEVAICKGCKALYWNKRWYIDEEQSTKLKSDMIKRTTLCPACQRMEDDNAAGIVSFSGDYLLEHSNEILNTVKNTEEKSRAKNPLARIMNISQEGNVLTVSTTDEKLAQKLGRDIYKAHSGSLQYQWSRDLGFVRVNWSR